MDTTGEVRRLPVHLLILMVIIRLCSSQATGTSGINEALESTRIVTETAVLETTGLDMTSAVLQQTTQQSTPLLQTTGLDMTTAVLQQTTEQSMPLLQTTGLATAERQNSTSEPEGPTLRSLATVVTTSDNQLNWNDSNIQSFSDSSSETNPTGIDGPTSTSIVSSTPLFDTGTSSLQKLTTYDGCVQHHCLNSGTCIVTSNGDTVCKCLPYYEGQNCEKWIWKKYEDLRLILVAVGTAGGITIVFLLITLIVVWFSRKKRSVPYPKEGRIFESQLNGWFPSLPRPAIKTSVYRNSSLELHESRQQQSATNQKQTAIRIASEEHIEANGGQPNLSFLPETDYNDESGAAAVSARAGQVFNVTEFTIGASNCNQSQQKRQGAVHF